MRTRREQRKIDRRTVGQYMFFAVMFTLTFLINLTGGVLFGQVCAVVALAGGADFETCKAVAGMSYFIVIPGTVLAWYYAQDVIFQP